MRILMIIRICRVEEGERERECERAGEKAGGKRLKRATRGSESVSQRERRQILRQ